MAGMIYNLFVYSDSRRVTDLGIMAYPDREEAPEEELLEFLHERSVVDHAQACKVRMTGQEVALEDFYERQWQGTTLRMFAELLGPEGKPISTFFVMTMIENGAVVDGLV